MGSEWMGVVWIPGGGMDSGVWIPCSRLSWESAGPEYGLFPSRNYQPGARNSQPGIVSREPGLFPSPELSARSPEFSARDHQPGARYLVYTNPYRKNPCTVITPIVKTLVLYKPLEWNNPLNPGSQKEFKGFFHSRGFPVRGFYKLGM